MKISIHSFGAFAFMAGAVGLFAPGQGCAQTSAPVTPAGAWQVSASVYGYLPSVGGESSFPVDAGGGTININADKIIDSLKMTFMGSMTAHNGQWGVFTDVMYLDVGNGKTGSREFTIGGIGLPAGTTANFDLDLKAWVWTLAGQYRVTSDPGFTLDLLAGARMLDLTQRLRWSLTGNIGPILPAGRTGASEVSKTLWDGIVGVRARYVFGDQKQWSVPLYVDVGTGQSSRTWQAAAGVGYAFEWGELSAMWRYLDYEMKSGKPIQNLNFGGPLIGATFRW